MSERGLRMKLKKSQLKNRYLFYAALIVIVLFVVGNIIITGTGKNTRREIQLVAQQNAQLEAQLRALEDELAFIKTDEGIELYARAQGMSMPGETHYSVH